MLDAAIKLISAVGVIAVVAVALVFVATTGPAWIRLMREYQQDEERRLDQKDRELKTLQEEFKKIESRQHVQTERLTTAENRVRDLAALLYGEREYVSRLERVCRKNNLALPRRNGIPEKGSE